MALSDEIVRVRQALEIARIGEAERITEAVQVHRVVGVLGEGEVGKTETIHQAIGHPAPGFTVVRLDLDGAANDEHVAFLLAKQVARGALGAADFSTLSGGILLPSEVEARRAELAQLLGVDGLEEALRDWPSGRYPLPKALDAVEKLASRWDVLLWIDHLEAPALTPRHPLKADRLLWGVREITQRDQGLRVLLSGREAIEGRLLGPDAAFHQLGQWLSIDNPPPPAWCQVARGLDLPESVASELANLTGGHPATMLLALLENSERGPREARETLRRLAALDSGLTARAMQHARTLHRLGGQLLIQVAQDKGPYAAAQRGATSHQEIRKVLGRLRLAGLIRHGDRWSIVNPLLRIGIGGNLQRVSAPNLEGAGAGDWKIF